MNSSREKWTCRLCCQESSKHECGKLFLSLSGNFQRLYLRYNNKPRPTAKHYLLCCTFFFIFQEKKISPAYSRRDWPHNDNDLHSSRFFATTWPKSFRWCSQKFHRDEVLSKDGWKTACFQYLRSNSKKYFDRPHSSTFGEKFLSNGNFFNLEFEKAEVRTLHNWSPSRMENIFLESIPIGISSFSPEGSHTGWLHPTQCSRERWRD